MSKAAQLRRSLEALPEPEVWPSLMALHERLEKPRGDWELPGLAYLAVVGAPSESGAGWLPLALLQASIILVDDILDQDEHGLARIHPPGVVANLALALQSLAFQTLEELALAPAVERAVCRCLTTMCVQTAYGQQLDVANLSGEENYWRLIRAKSAAFYRASLEVGALIAEAEAAIVAGLGQFGAWLGEIVQILDDQVDALEQPANADWLEGRNNLLILYALSADHPERERFRALRARATEREALAEAQRILGRCGAVSFAIYQRIDRLKAMAHLLVDLPLSNPQPLREQVMLYAHEIATTLSRTGVEVSAESLLL